MDDLWGSPHTQDVQDSHCYMRPGWHFDFCFGYWFDGIEEDALHEKSCIQVLRILITKADREIDELEKDLVTLHNELAWDEYEDWSEICSNALTEKINYLDISIKTLRNENENDIQINLLMHRESADRLHDIVKTLLKKYGQEKVEQVETHGVTVMSHSDSPQTSAELLEKTPSLDTSDDAEIIAKEEIGVSCNHREDSSEVLTSSQKCPENITDDLVPDKPPNVVCPIEEQLDNVVCSIEELLSDVKYSIGDLLLNANFVPDPHYLRSVHEESGKELSLKSLDIESTGLREAKELANDNGVVDDTSAIKERRNLEMVKIEPAGAVQDYTKNAFTSPISHHPISEVKIEEVENTSSLYLGDVPILNSAKIACIGENLKPTFTLSKNSSPITQTVATGKLTKMKNLCKSDLRPSGYDIARESHITATNKTKTFTALRLEKNVESDLEQKLRDFASSVACKQSLKGSSRRISKSLLMVEGKRKVGEGSLNATGHSSSTSLLNLQDNRGKDGAILQPKEEDDEEVPMDKIFSTDDELISNFPQKIPRQKPIKCLESNRVGILKTSYITMEKLPYSSSTSKAKMLPAESSKASSLLSFLSGKLTKRIVKRRPWETEEQTSDPLKDQNPTKKRKRSPSVGTITTSQETEHSSESNDDDDSGTEISVSSSDLMDLKMGDLRAIAKEQKLLHYYKLKKNDLVKQLISRLGCC